MRITMLVENTSSNPKVKPKHGLSVYIETGNHRVLFDAAWDDLFIRNAGALEIDLKAVDTFVISHGHGDHGKGLRDFMEHNKTAKIYIRKSAFDPHFIEVIGVKVQIGLDCSLMDDSRIIFTDEVHRIDGELLIFSDVTGKRLLSQSGNKLFAKKEGRMMRDDFSHEQNLLISEDGNNVLLAGCAHSGIYNIVEAAQRHCDKLSVCVGGFHLFDPPTRKYESKELIAELAEKLGETGARFYTCHCTGEKAYGIMREIMGDRVSYIRAGDSIEICKELKEG